MAGLAIPLISTVGGMSQVQAAFWLAANKGVLLAGAGTGIAAAGMIQQGRVAAAQAESAQNIADYNALVMQREAEAIAQKTAFAQRRHAEKGARLKSALTAKMAAAGGLGAPVAADLAAEQAAELELENLYIGYEGEIEKRKALSQAELDRLQGRIYKERGKVARKTSYYRAGGTLLTGFGAAYA